MILKPQDVLVLLKLALVGHSVDYRNLAKELNLSLSEVHNCIKRAHAARLLDKTNRRPRLKSLEEFLLHGVKYAYPSVRGGITRGIPTGYAAPPLNELILAGDDLSPVWPDANGPVRGYALSPLYASVPQAAMNDRKLYEVLALLDAIRDGQARERRLAAEMIVKYLEPGDAQAAS
jgi:hypothetical protein